MTAKPPPAAFSLNVRAGAMAWHIEINTVAELDAQLDQLRVARLVVDGLTGQQTTHEMRRRQLAVIVDTTDRLLDARPLLAVLEQWRDVPWWALDPDAAADGGHAVAGRSSEAV